MSDASSIGDDPSISLQETEYDGKGDEEDSSLQTSQLAAQATRSRESISILDELENKFGAAKSKPDVIKALETCKFLHRIPLLAPNVAVEQALKDFCRERVLLNDVAFIPDRFDTDRSRAFGMTLRLLVQRFHRINGVVNTEKYHQGGNQIADLLLMRACRTAAGADSFFTVQKMLCTEGTFVTQKTTVNDPPVHIDVFLAPPTHKLRNQNNINTSTPYTNGHSTAGNVSSSQSTSASAGFFYNNNNHNSGSIKTQISLMSSAGYSGGGVEAVGGGSDFMKESSGTTTPSKSTTITTNNNNNNTTTATQQQQQQLQQKTQQQQFYLQMVNNNLHLDEDNDNNNSSNNNHQNNKEQDNKNSVQQQQAPPYALCARIQVSNSFAIYDVAAMDSADFNLTTDLDTSQNNNGMLSNGLTSYCVEGPKPWLDVDTVVVDESNFQTGQHWRKMHLIVTCNDSGITYSSSDASANFGNGAGADDDAISRASDDGRRSHRLSGRRVLSELSSWLHLGGNHNNNNNNMMQYSNINISSINQLPHRHNNNGTTGGMRTPQRGEGGASSSQASSTYSPHKLKAPSIMSGTTSNSLQASGTGTGTGGYGGGGNSNSNQAASSSRPLSQNSNVKVVGVGMGGGSTYTSSYFPPTMGCSSAAASIGGGGSNTPISYNISTSVSQQSLAPPPQTQPPSLQSPPPAPLSPLLSIQPPVAQREDTQSSSAAPTFSSSVAEASFTPKQEEEITTQTAAVISPPSATVTSQVSSSSSSAAAPPLTRSASMLPPRHKQTAPPITIGTTIGTAYIVSRSPRAASAKVPSGFSADQPAESSSQKSPQQQGPIVIDASAVSMKSKEDLLVRRGEGEGKDTIPSSILTTGGDQSNFSSMSTSHENSLRTFFKL